MTPSAKGHRVAAMPSLSLVAKAELWERWRLFSAVLGRYACQQSIDGRVTTLVSGMHAVRRAEFVYALNISDAVIVPRCSVKQLYIVMDTALNHFA
jgi:hypothetical protein